MATFPSTASASDVWSLRDVYKAEAAGEWPAAEASLLTYTMSQSSVYSTVSAATYANMTDDNYLNTDATGTTSTANAYVRCDLGSDRLVTQVKIAPASNSMPGGWSPAYTTNRPVRYSSDGTNWTTAYTTPSSMTAGVLYTENVSFTARYVELYNSSGYVALHEFQVWGY